MVPLVLEHFIEGIVDTEKRQYEILDRLKKYYLREFSANRLYPHLKELVDLRNLLTFILEKKHALKGHAWRELEDVDLEHQRLVYRLMDRDSEYLANVFMLIAWALPRLQHAIEEGVVIFDFVAENLQIIPVGLVAPRLSEGFWLVPEHDPPRLHAYRYELTLYAPKGSDEEEAQHILKTTDLETVPCDPLTPPPASLKRELVRRYPALPNAAVFLCEEKDSALEFPYRETLFPVAKRIFLQYLSSEQRK